MRRFLVTLTVLHLCVGLCAQDTVRSRRQVVAQELFKGAHLGLTLTPHLAQKARIKKESGPYTMRSAHMEGLEAGFDYHIHFRGDYSLIIGLHGGASARNFILFIPAADFPPEVGHDYIDNGALTREFDFYMSAPLLVEKRWMTRPNRHWNLLAGVNVRYYPDEFYELMTSWVQTTDGQMLQIVNFDLEVGNAFKPWLNYNIGGGHTWLLGNNNLLRLNLLANFSGHELVKGTYQITVPGKEPTSGTYAANLSYLGLSVSYLLTGTNKRLRKLYEKQLNYR